MSKQAPQLHLERYGWVNAEILWIHDTFFKITFKQGFFRCRVTEVFHIKEILNFNEVFVTKDLKIVPYE